MTEQDDRTAARRAGEPESWDGKVLNELMATPQGRFFVERFLEFTGLGRPVYLNDGDALGMAHRDGLGNAGRYWETALLEHCPDLYLRMIRERRTRVERERQRQEREAARRDGPQDGHSGVTSIDELADQQLEAETAAAKPKPKQK